MPWSKWWSCPCHQQESPRPADYLYSLDSHKDIHRHEIRDQECWQMLAAGQRPPRHRPWQDPQCRQPRPGPAWPQQRSAAARRQREGTLAPRIQNGLGLGESVITGKPSPHNFACLVGSHLCPRAGSTVSGQVRIGLGLSVHSTSTRCSRPSGCMLQPSRFSLVGALGHEGTAPAKEAEAGDLQERKTSVDPVREDSQAPRFVPPAPLPIAPWS